MRWRSLAVVGLATTCSGRRLRLRQAPSYEDANSTAVAPTAVVVSTSLVTVSPPPPPPPPPAYSSPQSETTEPSPIVAPVPYSSPQPPPASYVGTTTTTAVETAVETTVLSATAPTAYSSQQYSYAPPGSAPSEASPPPPASTGTAPGYTSPAGTAPPSYVSTVTGTAPQPTVYTTVSANDTCSGATLNVLEASLDWWYTKTLYYAVSTVSILFNGNDTSTGWTVLPATTSFNVTSALAEPDCTSTKTFVPSANASLWDVSCTPAPSPVAAETTVITQTAYKDPPTTSGNGSLPKLVITPKPASISVSDATQEPYAQGTPFVFFSQYEIVTKTSTVFNNGSSGCAEVTQAYQMAEPFSFEFTGGDVNGSQLVGAGVTGDVNPALLGLVGQDTAVAGSWVAEPTVVLLMQEVFVAQAALAATIEPTASTLDVPGATTPPFITLAPTGPKGPPAATYNSPVVESTQTELQVPTRTGDDNRPTGAIGQNEGDGEQTTAQQTPAKFTSLVAFIAHIAHSEVTLDLPANPTQTVVTAEYDGQTVTATAASMVDGNHPGGVGGLIGAINSAAKPSPTNAFDVLSQAEATFAHSNPTANAIINGMGGPAASGGGGGSPQEDSLPGGGGNGGSGAITVGGAVITPNGQNVYNLPGGQTLTPGGVAVVAGTTVSLDSDASAVVVNGVTQTMGSQAQATGGANIPLIAMGSAAITPNAATEYSIAPGATLTPGGSVVVDGTTMALDAAGTAIVVNGVTRNLASPAGPITAGGAVITPNAAGAYSIAPGTTLTPGGMIVADGTTMSLDAAGTALIVNGATRSLASPAQATAGDTTMAPILTIDGHTYHAINGGTTYVIDGQTLTMGGGEATVTIDGTAYQLSLAPSATRLVVETENADGAVTATSTQTLFPEQGSGAGTSATASASGSAGPEEQVGSGASSVTMASWTGGVAFAVGSLMLAVWL